MTHKRDVKADFLKDIASHGMDVRLDRGLYRHAVFSNGGSFCHHFEIITTPWILMITGDMGTWAFRRVVDMFEFFRSADLAINPHYWREKVINGEGGNYSSAMEYDGDYFREAVISAVKDNYSLSKNDLEEVLEAIDEIDFHDNEAIVRNQLYNMDFRIEDLWEISGRTCKYHFLWCCYAIVWAIMEWDKYILAKESAV